MARLKINRFKLYSMVGRDRHPYSLQDSLNNTHERRRSYKNWIVAAFSLICLNYFFKYGMYNDYDAVMDSTTLMIIDTGDEFLTTSQPLTEKRITTRTPQTQAVPTSTEPTRFYKFAPLLALRTTSTTKRGTLKPCTSYKRVGNYPLNMTRLQLYELANMYPTVGQGGYYKPPNCVSRRKIAIVVAFRGRDTSLSLFLNNIHPFLMMQHIEYQIFVIEQSGLDLFNKGRLYNVGIREVSKLKKFECIVFHDVDLLPTRLEIQYSCPTLPRHMSAVINDTEIKKSGHEHKFESIFGGVVSMTMEMMSGVNGYSNLYFGWGGEDNDMLWRLRASGYPLVRYNKTIGIYLVLPHNRAPVNEYRHHLLATAVERYKTDGLSNLEYKVISRTSNHLYTHLVVDINPRKENISLWYKGKGIQ